MILFLDIGNSRIKWATQGRHKRNMLHSAERPESEQWAAFADEHWSKLKPPKKIVIANVAGAAYAEAIKTWMEERWQVPPHFVVPEHAAFDVTNGYCVPERLGVDRWAALVGARKRWRGCVCIVDVGTAITIDVLAADGRHLGGLIMPGLDLMRQSLLERSEGIRLATASPAHGDINLLARDTQAGIDGGTLYAAVAAIDRVMNDVAAEMGTPLTRVITGGDAEKLLPLLAGTYHHKPELVMDGLAIIAEAV